MYLIAEIQFTMTNFQARKGFGGFDWLQFFSHDLARSQIKFSAKVDFRSNNSCTIHQKTKNPKSNANQNQRPALKKAA